jgi:hypothetical protein
VAGGAGRHTRFLLGRGHHVTVIDRDCSALDDLNQHPRATVLKADLEACVPFLGTQFGVVLVTNFLLRSVFPYLIAAVGPGGYLIYETFTSHHARYRRPQDSRHLAAPGELQNLVTDELEVIAYEEVVEGGSRQAAVARLVATRRDADPWFAKDGLDGRRRDNYRVHDFRPFPLPRSVGPLGPLALRKNLRSN